MTATVNVEEGNGAAGSVTWSVITQGRYCTADAFNPVDANPCVVPASSFYYSYWKHFRLAFSGTFTKINNIRWFGPGNIKATWGLGTGGMLLVAKRDSGDNGCPVASYVQATGTPSVTGTYIKAETGHTYYKDQTVDPADADGYVAGTPLTIDTTDYTAEGYSKCVVTQAKIAPDATQGEKTNITFTLRYDEI
jgi:hypothetical protein